MKGSLRSCETSGSDYLVTQCHTVEEGNPQVNRCEELAEVYKDTWKEAVMSIHKQGCVDSSNSQNTNYYLVENYLIYQI